ncbi:MAG: hypothetical protein LBE36_10400 [Flavobacteriaceae bacterium]|jgi:hypothetical protein|nr:hypothetical protein [Flavobacteriaceae bacterium]
MKNTISILLKLSVFNFFIVAVLGVIMRYKIAYSFPFLDQKNLQESHSHFAFYGWITSIIYLLILKILHEEIPDFKAKKYIATIIINLIGSYGMLAAFLYSGYYWLSIVFSSISLLSSFVYFFMFLSDYKNLKTLSRKWFVGGFVFALFSSLGVFMLSYMMVSGHIFQHTYLASTYFYLHFQYNGFFIFSCIGLLINNLEKIGAVLSEKENKSIFLLMFISCFAAYGLSVLWAKLPIWVYVIIVLASLMQTFGSLKLFNLVRRNWNLLKENWNSFQRFILIYAGLAFFVKILLQLGSTIPAVNQFAFGFRNIVIAYLHLVLLMCITSFLFLQIFSNENRENNSGVKLFLLGTFLNELVLGIMGILSIKYIIFPYSQHILFGISVLLMISAWMIFARMKQHKSRFIETGF